VAEHEVFFVINDHPDPWRGEVRVSARRGGMRWDPGSGDSTPIPGDAASLLQLDGYGGALLTFDAMLPAVAAGLTPGPVFSAPAVGVSVGAPRLSQGEFVRAELDPVPTVSQRGDPAWRTVATLTRGKVDTFLFVTLPLSAPAALREAALLEVESWVPAGQRTPAQLLVILHEEGGGDFLAETPRSLGAGGREVSYLPLDRFELAGWSRDADGRLDRSRVSEIRIGWGGYYGTEGERVEFSFGAPRVARVGAAGR
jgi:hypothetical protein